MTELQFAYWLQGFAELHGDEPPTAEQWKAIREHLALVFRKVTPSIQQPARDQLTRPVWPMDGETSARPVDPFPLRSIC